jgi:uncharacterized protein (TIGR03086 family)
MAEREVASRYRVIAMGLGARVAGCGDEDWGLATPCPQWTVRDVLTHVLTVHRNALALLDGVGAAQEQPEGDIVTTWNDASGAMHAALRDPVSATCVVSTPFGEMPFEDLASRMVCSDTLVHTWDVARATGQDEHLDDGAVEIAWSWMEPAGDRLRANGAFGPAVTPVEGANTQTRLLCFLGRAV